MTSDRCAGWTDWLGRKCRRYSKHLFLNLFIVMLAIWLSTAALGFCRRILLSFILAWRFAGLPMCFLSSLSSVFFLKTITCILFLYETEVLFGESYVLLASLSHTLQSYYGEPNFPFISFWVSERVSCIIEPYSSSGLCLLMIYSRQTPAEE